MNEVLMLVDLENIQRFDLTEAPPNAHVKFFVGQLQSKVSTDLFEEALALGSRFQLVRIDGNGRNALDFHIACHLGEGICKYPKAEFVILSNDKGFDPLVRHLVARGFKCRRDGQAPSTPVSKPQLPAHAQAVADLLRRSEKNKRPRKRATLANYLATHFHKKLSGEEIKQAVEHLLEAGLIAGTEAAVTYNF
jgi:PIN domain